MGFIKSITQKYIYTLISAYIRSPGCLLTCFYCIPVLKDFKYTSSYFSLLINCILVFINGQYYSKLACIDYGKKISIYHPYTKKELYPNLNNKEDYPWRNIKEHIAQKVNDIALIWNCTNEHKKNAFKNEIFTTKDPKLNFST